MSRKITDGARRRIRIVEALSAYGADPARWPVADREELSLRETSRGDEELRQLLAEAREIDRVLNAASLPSPARDAEARLIARTAATERRPDRTRALGSRRHQPGLTYGARIGISAALAASLAIGFFVGTTDLGATLFGDFTVTAFDIDAELSVSTYDLTGVEDAIDS